DRGCLFRRFQGRDREWCTQAHGPGGTHGDQKTDNRRRLAKTALTGWVVAAPNLSLHCRRFASRRRIAASAVAMNASINFKGYSETENVLSLCSDQCRLVRGWRMSLKVIGAGFGRTGTDSMREALNLLGFGPCHHMREVIDG